MFGISILNRILSPPIYGNATANCKYQRATTPWWESDYAHKKSLAKVCFPSAQKRIQF